MFFVLFCSEHKKQIGLKASKTFQTVPKPLKSCQRVPKPSKTNAFGNMCLYGVTPGGGEESFPQPCAFVGQGSRRISHLSPFRPIPWTRVSVRSPPRAILRAKLITVPPQQQHSADTSVNPSLWGWGYNHRCALNARAHGTWAGGFPDFSGNFRFHPEIFGFIWFFLVSARGPPRAETKKNQMKPKISG